MCLINEQIDRILDMRLGRGKYEGRGHLQAIEAKIETLQATRSSVVRLQNIINSIKGKSTPNSISFYNALSQDPDALTAYHQISSNSCESAVERIDAAIDDINCVTAFGNLLCF